MMITAAPAPPACSAHHAAARRRCGPHSHGGHRRFSGQTRGGRYSWARYYHPTFQRFVSEDPIELESGDTNFYSYVWNRPSTFVDPFGLDKALSPIEEEGLGTPLLDPIDLLGSGVFTVPARVVGRAGGKILFSLGKHAARRMAEAEVTEKMIEVALRKGDKYWDPTNRVTNYVLEQGFASGKSLLVGQNPVTGKITTVIKGRDLVSPRFIPLK